MAWCAHGSGSRDFAQEQFDHVGQARRQPGSTFKPFVYGAAFMQGFKPTATFIDQPVAITLPGKDVWTAERRHAAFRPAYDAAATASVFSKNTITAQLMQKVGPERVAQLAQAMGIRQSKLDPVMSLAVGTSPVTLRENGGGVRNRSPMADSMSSR
jgi:penicillin-binding protein 1A